LLERRFFRITDKMKNADEEGGCTGGSSLSNDESKKMEKTAAAAGSSEAASQQETAASWPCGCSGKYHVRTKEESKQKY
jgi:hypothetical protein